MHYYSFNIKDYRKDTFHLQPMEHYIYRQLIDWYYLDEKPIPKKTQSVLRRLSLDSEEHKQMLENVLDDFFEEKEDGFHHKRIDDEIAAYQEQVEKNRQNGKKGGRPPQNKPKKTQSVITQNPTESKKKPNQEPVTNNHKPIKYTHTHNAREKNLPTDEFEPPPSQAEQIREQHSSDISDWQPPPLSDMVDMLALAGVSAKNLTDEQYQLHINDFKAYYADQALMGKPLTTDSNRIAKLRQWLQRANIDKQITTAKLDKAHGRFSTDNEYWGSVDWSTVGRKPEATGYHPSHSQPTHQAKPDPKTSVVLNGLWKPPLPSMSIQETYDHIQAVREPSETADETYDRVYQDLMKQSA